MAKNKQLLKPSGVWAASVCSPPPSLRPSSPPLPSLHLSITHTHTHTHRITPHICTLLRTHNRVHKHTHQLHPAASLLYFLCRRPPVWLSAAQENRARDTEKGWWIKKTQECEEKQQIEWEKRAEEKCENVLKLSPIKTDLEGHKSLSHRTLSLSLSLLHLQVIFEWSLPLNGHFLWMWCLR